MPASLRGAITFNLFSRNHLDIPENFAAISTAPPHLRRHIICSQTASDVRSTNPKIPWAVTPSVHPCRKRAATPALDRIVGMCDVTFGYKRRTPALRARSCRVRTNLSVRAGRRGNVGKHAKRYNSRIFSCKMHAPPRTESPRSETIPHSRPAGFPLNWPEPKKWIVDDYAPTRCLVQCCKSRVPSGVETKSAHK